MSHKKNLLNHDLDTIDISYFLRIRRRKRKYFRINNTLNTTDLFPNIVHVFRRPDVVSNYPVYSKDFLFESNERPLHLILVHTKIYCPTTNLRVNFFVLTSAGLTLSSQQPNLVVRQQPSLLGPWAGLSRSSQHPQSESVHGVASSQPLKSGPLALVKPSGQHPCSYESNRLTNICTNIQLDVKWERSHRECAVFVTSPCSIFTGTAFKARS